jgi:hypothetical protein
LNPISVGWRWFQQQTTQARLLKMTIRGQCAGDLALARYAEGQAIGKAPVLVRAVAVETDRGFDAIANKRNDFDLPAGVTMAIAFSGRSLCRRLPWRSAIPIEPLQW